MSSEDALQDTVRVADRSGAGGGYALFLINEAGVRIVPLSATGCLVVGRGSDADVRVADGRVSRQHARLHLGGAFAIEDLHSANGTCVDGCRVVPEMRHAFAPGEAIAIGDTTLFVRRHTTGLATSLVDGPSVEATASDILRPVLELADRVAPSMISVLLLGETGVGKDVLARRIHRASRRADGPFLHLNCAAFSPALLASELFGHEKGAFTGATSAQPGLLRSAGGGTVFLDEIGDLPVDLQAKLLLVLERREVLPVGAVRSRPLDVRFVAATNRDLPDDVAAGSFRRDLFYRLNGITIRIPPLRARGREIDALAQLFAHDAARAIGKAPPLLTEEVLAALRGHPWPGNIRELRAVIDRAVLLCADDVVQLQDIALAANPLRPAGAPASPSSHARPDHDRAERQRIADILATCGGNQSRAAKLLGMSRNTLIARIAKYGIARPLSAKTPP